MWSCLTTSALGQFDHDKNQPHIHPAKDIGKSPTNSNSPGSTVNCQQTGMTNAETALSHVSFAQSSSRLLPSNIILPDMLTQPVIAAFEAAQNRWITCDWSTEFGEMRLNVQGLRSSQLLRLADATSGEETREWRKAADWVRRIEDDATTAQHLAHRALEAFQNQEHSQAISLAERAVQLESTWHETQVWRSLLDAVLAACGGVGQRSVENFRSG